jgi:hypothetical protein
VTRTPPAIRIVAVLGVALACGMPDPEPLPRILSAAPEGEAVSPGTTAEIRFEAPVDPDGLTDGRRLVLVRADALRAAVAAVESDAGALELEGTIACDSAVDPGGRRVELRPLAPLRAWTGHALVLSSRVRAADGRAVLDPEGRRRTFVRSFATGAPEGPPGVPVLTEVLVDAATPEAGGEYVEILNVGEGPLDLAGWRLGKRSASGALSSCEISAPAGVVLAPGAVGLVGGGAWDGRYELPAGVPVLSCGATALLGGIANDRAPALLLADPTGAVIATFGAGGGPICVAVEKIDPRGPDEPANLTCTSGSPGTLPAG